MATILCEQSETEVAGARADREALWLRKGDLERATGWVLKPEGLCKGELCVPVAKGAAAKLVAGDEVDVAGFWRHMGAPVAHDQAGAIWLLGTSAGDRSRALTTLQAPDFELPDLDGKKHRLSDYRGRKVLIASWASW
jgi:hypothetical protein